jgi:hypothetical protein
MDVFKGSPDFRRPQSDFCTKVSGNPYRYDGQIEDVDDFAGL